MADRLLLESSAVDGYLLENGSGVLLMEVVPVTSTAALTIIPSIVAAGAETITGSGALTIVPAVVAAGAESLTSTAALTIVPAVTAAGSEKITGSAALTIVPAITAAGAETITGSAALTIVPTVAAVGTVTEGAPAVPPTIILGVGGGFAGGGTGAPASKAQRAIERQVDELIDSLLTETPAAAPPEVASPKPVAPVETPPRTPVIAGPRVQRIGTVALPAAPAVPVPEPWILQIPSAETDDHSLRLLLAAATVLTS